MKMQAEIDDGNWILAVKDQIAKANPKILMRRVFAIFKAGSETMVFFHKCHDVGLTPAETFDRFIAKFGKEVIE